MSKLTWLIAAMAFSISANASAQSAAAETELSRLVTHCNGIADSPTAKRRNIRACETLANNGRLSLADPATIVVYQRYQQERVQACQRGQESPRGQSRRQPECRLRPWRNGQYGETLVMQHGPELWRTETYNIMR